MVINWLTEEIDNILFAACTIGGADVLLGEHGTFLIRALVLQPVDERVQFFDLIDKIKSETH